MVSVFREQPIYAYDYDLDSEFFGQQQLAIKIFVKTHQYFIGDTNVLSGRETVGLPTEQQISVNYLNSYLPSSLMSQFLQFNLYAVIQDPNFIFSHFDSVLLLRLVME